MAVLPTRPLAREANRRLVEGKWIWLLFDGQPRDAQGRLRAWVWRDGLFVNGALRPGRLGGGAATDPRLAEYFATFEASARHEAPRAVAEPPLDRVLHGRSRSDLGDSGAGGPDTGDTEDLLGAGALPAADHVVRRRAAPAVPSAGRGTVTRCPDRANDRQARATPLLLRGTGTRTVK